ncbi:MAG: Gfo/Idh/MocA family oxidoreductase [Bacteroidota bacterium]
MNKEIGWGIIGLGNIAHAFVKDLKLVEGISLTAVASRSVDKAAAFASLYGAEQHYGNYEALMKNPEVDIVYIATPHDSHADLSIKAMEHGKHVLCEKPLAVNAAQVSKMINIARQKGVFFMEAFWTRFNPTFEACLKLVNEGAIGTVNYINADFSFLRNDPVDSRMLNMDLAGGSLLDMGVYPVFLAYSILGMPIDIKATATFHNTGADLQTSALLKYKGGIALIMSGFKSQSDMTAKIYGTEGRIYLKPYWHETQGYTLIKGNDGKEVKSEHTLPTIGKGFTYEIRECIQCILNEQQESTKWSWQNSLDLITIVDGIRKQTNLHYPFE